jgi:ABC-type polysaccharide/polyol phosphate transport system ATPase subunit
MSKKEITERLDKIIEFSGIKNFIDVPVYTYSSGMKLRLGMGVAVYSDSDILLMDEGVLAGDMAFVEKINEYIKSFPGSIVAVSHWKEFLDKFCTNFIIFKNGKIEV